MGRFFIAGEWYLTIVCNNCGERVPVVHASGEKSQIVGYYTLVCPLCGNKAYYSHTAIERYKHEESKLIR